MEVRPAQEIWEAALGELQLQVSKPNYKTWLGKTVGLSVQDNQFVVGVPNTFVAEYLEQNQRSLIEKTLASVVGEAVMFVCQVALASKVREAETIDDKIRALLNAGREIAGDEKTDRDLAFLDEEPRDKDQLEDWFEELTKTGEKAHDSIHSD